MDSHDTSSTNATSIASWAPHLNDIENQPPETHVDLDSISTVSSAISSSSHDMQTNTHTSGIADSLSVFLWSLYRRIEPYLPDQNSSAITTSRLEFQLIVSFDTLHLLRENKLPFQLTPDELFQVGFYILILMKGKRWAAHEKRQMGKEALQKASVQGHVLAAIVLAQHATSRDEAREWLKVAARSIRAIPNASDRNDFWFSLYMTYSNALGLSPESPPPLRVFKIAAASMHFAAELALSNVYEHGKLGCRKNLREAQRWMYRAIYHGNIYGYAQLASRLTNTRRRKRIEATLMRLIEENQKHAPGFVAPAAAAIAASLESFDLDPKGAFTWWKRAADANDQHAVMMYAIYLHYGAERLGLPSDPNQVVQLYSKLGRRVGDAALAVCYESGYGVPQDAAKATALRRKAQLGGAVRIYETAVRIFLSLLERAELKQQMEQQLGQAVNV